MVVWAPESDPITALPQVTGSPTKSLLTWAVVKEVFAELCRKSAVRVVDWPTRIGLGVAVFVSTIHGWFK